MTRKSQVLLVLGLLLVSAAALAEPAAVATQAATVAASSGAGEAISTPAAGACAAKTAVASFSEYPTCSSCSGDGCRGEYVGTICGLDEFDRIMVCQDQLTGCYPNTYPETIFCRCTADIVP